MTPKAKRARLFPVEGVFKRIHNVQREYFVPTKEPIVKIQKGMQASTRQLKQAIGQLHLPQILEALRGQYPIGIDIEAIKDDLVCPPLAWEMHNEVANAKILLEEAVVSLEKAVQQTAESVAQEWYRQRLEEIKDPSAQSLLQYLFRDVI